jgi:Na+-transporting methylmalonyl-CoA/oxaloacetate decarboxylase gamma subunit
VLAVLVGVGMFVVTRVADILPTCTATIGDETYRITPEQSENAQTIAEVAAAEGMPNHAVTVAIAAALQESKLRNI